MPRIVIELSDTMYEELQSAASATVAGESSHSPAGFAAECVESVLASRRLPRFERPPQDPPGEATQEVYHYNGRGRPRIRNVERRA
jgi:hypothetical protein